LWKWKKKQTKKAAEKNMMIKILLLPWYENQDLIECVCRYLCFQEVEQYLFKIYPTIKNKVESNRSYFKDEICIQHRYDDVASLCWNGCRACLNRFNDLYPFATTSMSTCTTNYIITRLASFGHVHCLKYFVNEMKITIDADEAFSESCIFGHLECIKYIFSVTHMDITCFHLFKTIWYDNIQCLEYLFSLCNRELLERHACEMSKSAVLHGSIQCLQYLFNQGLLRYEKATVAFFVQCSVETSKVGDCLMFLHENGYVLGEHERRYILFIGSDHLYDKIIKDEEDRNMRDDINIVKNGGVIESHGGNRLELIHVSCIYGNVAMIRKLCGIYILCNKAILHLIHNGHLNILQEFMIDRRRAWPISTINTAIFSGRVNVVRFFMNYKNFELGLLPDAKMKGNQEIINLILNKLNI
jgi:hypothetical protein